MKACFDVEPTKIAPRGPRPALLNLVLALLLLHLAACSNYQTLSVEQAVRDGPPAGVSLGSLVKVTTLDRRSDTFRVTRLDEQGLGGDSFYYRYAELKSLKVEQKQKKQSERAAVIWTIVGLVALGLLIANADSVSVCSPPCETPTP